MADLRGQIINGYELRTLIGHGGMGNVYYGIHRQSGQPVAVKCFKTELAAANTELLERFEREGEILRQLDHPNIVKVLATFNQNEQHFIVMEYVSGGSLRSMLDKMPQLPIEQVLTIALDLADALTRAHRLNIIHRDIKPANVLLAEDGTPRLTDFGVAYLSHKPRVTKADAVMGTLDYLSPEALNSEEVDARMDIWAFGVMIFEMLAGRRPFDERTAAATALAIIQKPFPDLEALRPDAPVALVDLVYRMLEKDRRVRISSVRLVGAELEAISKGTDVKLQVARRVADDGKPVFGTSTSITGVSKHNLPAQTTPFVGRQTELAELTRLLTDPTIRLITVLGLGGMGKSRLALEVASAQVAGYPQGIYFVSMASLSSISQLISAIAQAVNFNFYQSENLKQQLLDYLREKEVLLVMDSFEHILESANLISELLRHAPHVTVLATSREKLNLYGETVFMIGGMPVPDRHTLDQTPDFDSVKLFVQSARRAMPHFELHPDDYKCVAKICQLVQGMPLGIELAAAWVEMLSLHEIAEEIDQGLDFLETEESGIPERHRSIRAVFEYTWNCLDDSEQALMKMLSVFQGGCTRKAAQMVTGASLQKLTSLVNRSLLRRNPDGRYEMQQLLRQSIEERLSADERWQVQARHAQYYAEWLDEREIPLRGAEQKAILGEIAADLENIRAAWYWATEHSQAEILGKAMHSVYTYFLVLERGHEGERGFESAAAALRSDLRSEQNRYQLGRLLARQGWLTSIKKAETLFRESIDLLRPFNMPDELAFALMGMGSTLLRHDHEQAWRYLEEGRTLYQSTGNTWGERIALFWLSFWANAQDQPEQAKQFLLESLKTAEAINDNLGAMMCYQELGNTARGQGQYEEAAQYYRGSLTIAREIAVRGDIARSLRSLGNIARALGQYPQAEQLLNESLTIYKELGNWARLARVLYELGNVACMQGQYPGAVLLFEKSLHINEEFCCDTNIEDGEEQDYQERLYQEADRQEGQVYALTGLGEATFRMKEYGLARDYLLRALRAATDTGTIPVVHITLIAIAEFLAAAGEQARAAELSAFVLQAASWQETRDRAQRLLTDLKVVLPKKVFATSVDQGSKLELKTVIGMLQAGI